MNSTEPVDFARTKDALIALYRLLYLTPPAQFEFVASPHAAFSSFHSWSRSTGRFLNMLWAYQLPLCDPSGYWRQSTRTQARIEFATLRKPNSYGCYVTADEVDAEPATAISDELHTELWADFSYPLNRNWCDVVVNSLWKTFPDVEASLDDAFHSQTPRSQAGVDETMFLGPFDWLHREVACVDFCSSILGVPCNTQLYSVLQSCLQLGGLILTFENLCIVCERPTTIDQSIVFDDGTEAIWPQL